MIGLDGPAEGLAATALTVGILVPPFLLAWRRTDPLAAGAAVLAAAVTTSLAGTIAVITRTPSTPWLVLAVPALYVAAFELRRRRPHDASEPRSRWSVAGPAAAITSAAAVVPVLQPPVGWDARSIWYFHASWFGRDVPYGELAREAPFSHPDYPPWSASFGGFAWLFADARNDWVPQFATALLTVVAVVVLAVMVASVASSRRSAAAWSAATALAAVSLVGTNGFDGYVDTVAAVLVTVVILGAALDDADPLVLVVAAASAALAKNEALLFLVGVALPLHVLSGRLRIGRGARVLAPGLGAGVIWAVSIRTYDLDLESWQLANVLPWSTDWTGRLGATVGTLAGLSTLHGAVLLWAGALLFALSGNPRARRLALVTGVGAVGLLGVITLGFLMSPQSGVDGLQGHLDYAADRLALHPAILLSAGSLATAAAALRPATAPVPSADSVEDHGLLAP